MVLREKVVEGGLPEEATLPETQRALAAFLGVGALAWMAVALWLDRTDGENGAAAGATALTFIAIGAWAIYPARRSVLGLLASVLISLGSGALAALILLPATVYADFDGLATIERIVAVTVGIGILTLGLSLLFDRNRRHPVLGVFAAGAALLWSGFALADFGSSAEQALATLPAIALAAVMVNLIRPSAGEESARFAIAAINGLAASDGSGADVRAGEARRALAYLLLIGAGLWIFSAIAFDRTGSNDAGAATAATAFLLVSVGIWIVYPIWSNLLAIAGSVIASLGAAAIAALILLRVTSLDLPGDREAIETGAAIALGLGVLMIGFGLVVDGNRRQASLGATAGLAALIWTAFAASDYGTATEQTLGILPAAALAAIAIHILRPETGRDLARMIGAAVAELMPLGQSARVVWADATGRTQGQKPRRRPDGAKKAHQPARPDDERLALPIVPLAILTLGVVLLLAELLISEPINIAWPFLLIVPGMLVAGGAFASKPTDAANAVRGGALIVLGLVFLYQAATGHWSSWAYAWALLMPAAGIALAIAGLRDREETLVTSGTGWIVTGTTIFVVLGVMFDHVLLETPDASGYFVPVVTTLLGVMVLAFRYLATRRGVYAGEDGSREQAKAT